MYNFTILDWIYCSHDLSKLCMKNEPKGRLMGLLSNPSKFLYALQIMAILGLWFFHCYYVLSIIYIFFDIKCKRYKEDSIKVN